MTEQDSTNNTDTDSMTRAEYIAMIMDVYDVPIDLVRYQRIDIDTE